ncbi:hypothetical protein HZA44_02155 [Candidatus Peregrinibacteria bacterium]|nr:hypothetical protein [Candidatus Peregrinibacteria bacterium]
MLSNLIIASAFIAVSLAILLNFERTYQAAERGVTMLIRVIRKAKLFLELLSRVARNSNRLPYYS